MKTSEYSQRAVVHEAMVRFDRSMRKRNGYIWDVEPRLADSRVSSLCSGMANRAVEDMDKIIGAHCREAYHDPS